MSRTQGQWMNVLAMDLRPCWSQDEKQIPLEIRHEFYNDNYRQLCTDVPVACRLAQLSSGRRDIKFMMMGKVESQSPPEQRSKF